MTLSTRPVPPPSVIVRQADRSSDPAATCRSRSRRAAVAALVLLTTLPLQFQTLAELPVGELRWFHIGAVVMVLLYPGALRGLPALVRELRVLLVALIVLTVVMVVSLASYGGGLAEPLQHLTYAGVGLVFVLTLREALADTAGRTLLIWAAPATVAATFVELLRRIAENGLDPVVVLRTTVVDLDPNLLIFGVFRSGTETGEVIQPANIRHEIMAAVVVAVLVSMLAVHLARRYALVIAAVAAVAGSALVVVSLSRAVLLPLILVAVGAAIRVWLRVVLTKASLVGILALLIAAPIVGSLLYGRFVDDTGSYEERLGAFSRSSGELVMRVLGGGPQLTEVQDSTHTLVFDTLLQGGWLAGLASVVIVAVIVRYTLSAYARYFTSGSVTELVAFTAGMLAIVRAFTIGGGFLHQVEWVEIGLLIALAAGGLSGTVAVRPSPGEPSSGEPSPEGPASTGDPAGR